MIFDLPAEPKAALSLFRSRQNDWTDLLRQGDFGQENYDETLEAVLLFYFRVVPKAFPDKNITIFQKLSAEDRLSKYEDIIDQYLNSVKKENVSDAIDNILKSFEAQEIETFGLAYLNNEEKKRVHDNIEKIRNIIGDGSLSDRKRNALYERLNALAKEVDLHGTSTDRFFAFMADAAFAVSGMTKNAKPFLDEVKDMIKTVGRSRARKEGVSLPPGDEILQLPSP